MEYVMSRYLELEKRLVTWMAAHAVTWMRLSLGIIFLWFGGLKLIPGASPAEALAGETIVKLTFGLLDAPTALVMLAVWETLIGLALVFGVFQRAALALLLVQMAGTFTPLLLFPADTFSAFPYAPTLEGQYILKNLVLVSGALVVGATQRGGKLTNEAIVNAEPCGTNCHTDPHEVML